MSKNLNVQFVRDYAEIDIVKFNEALSCFPETDLNVLSVHQKFSKQQKHIMRCTNRFAPLRKLSCKEFKFKLKAWLSTGILISIKLKNHLYWL